MTLPLIALKQSTVWGRKGGLGEDIYFPLPLSLSCVLSLPSFEPFGRRSGQRETAPGSS